MSLHAVLSALRVIILDGIELPIDKTIRGKVYAEKFPGLSHEELEDLLEIPPDKFSIYTSTVFSGQRGTLETHFPFTFALLNRRLKESGQPQLDTFELVRQIHSFAPWQGYPTDGLTSAFARFLQHPENPFAPLAPECGDSAEIERLSLHIARGINPWDSQLRDRNYVTSESLSQLSVGDLLELSCHIPDNVRSMQATYDVLSLRKEFFRLNNNLPEQHPQKKSCAFLGGRDKENYVRWIEVSEEEQNLLKPSSSAMLTVESFAELFMNSALERAAEEERANPEYQQILLSHFLERLFLLIDSGILFLFSNPELHRKNETTIK